MCNYQKYHSQQDSDPWAWQVDPEKRQLHKGHRSHIQNSLALHTYHFVEHVHRISDWVLIVYRILACTKKRRKQRQPCTHPSWQTDGQFAIMTDRWTIWSMTMPLPLRGSRTNILSDVCTNYKYMWRILYKLMIIFVFVFSCLGDSKWGCRSCQPEYEIWSKPS